MDTNSLIRIAALCVVLACAETLHGIFRTVVVIPRIGKERAIKLSALTGTVLAFAICWMLVPDIGLRTPGGHVLLGIGLAAFMAVFDIAVGRLLMRKAWAKIWPDFNPATGNYLAYGLAALCFIPLVVWFAKAQGHQAAAGPIAPHSSVAVGAARPLSAPAASRSVAAMGATIGIGGPSPRSMETSMTTFLVHVTCGPDDPTRAALAFLLARTAADEGHAVSLFLAGDGVTLLRDENLKSVVGLGTGRLEEHFHALAAKGVRFHLSGMSAKARGMSDQDLAGKPAEFGMPSVLVRLAAEADRVITY